MDITFTNENEMIVCGVSFLGIFTFNSHSNKWICKYTADRNLFTGKESTFASCDCFGVCYESSTQLIYVSNLDGNGKIFVFDKCLELVQVCEGKVRGYGMAINERTGEFIVCNSSSYEVLIFK